MTGIEEVLVKPSSAFRRNLRGRAATRMASDRSAAGRDLTVALHIPSGLAHRHPDQRVGEAMTKRDAVTGLTDAELAKLADEAYNERDNPEAWEAEAAPKVSPDVRSVVSVRFSRGELEPIERAAAAAGVPVSTYIRNAAVNAVAPIDLDEARHTIQALQSQLDGLANTLRADDSAKPTRPAKRR